MKDILIKFLSLICAIAGIIGIKVADLPTIISIILTLIVVLALIVAIAIDFTKQDSVQKEST